VCAAEKIISVATAYLSSVLADKTIRWRIFIMDP